MRNDPDFPDFTRCQLKVNAAGSWANVLTLTTEDYDRVKTACLTLAECAEGRVRFKLLDADGGILEVLDYDRDAHATHWHAPRRTS